MAASLGLIKYLQDQRAGDQMAQGYDKQRFAISQALQSGADPYEAAYQNMPKKSGGISMPGLSNFLVNMGGAFNPGGLGGRIQKNFGPATQGRVAEESLNRQKADQLVNDMKLESVQKANLSQLAADPNITGVSTNKEGNVNLKFTTPKQVGEGQVLQNQMAAGGYNPMSALQQNQDITKQLQGMQGGSTEGASEAGAPVIQSTSPTGANAAQSNISPVPGMLPEPEQQTRLQALQGQAPAQAAPTMEDYAQMMQEQGYEMPEVSEVLGSNPSISSGEQAATPEPSMISRILGSIGPSEAQAGGRQRKIGEGFGLTAEQVLAIDKRAEEATSAPYDRAYKKALIQQIQQNAQDKNRKIMWPVQMPDGTTKQIPFTPQEWVNYQKGIWAADNARQRAKGLTPWQQLMLPKQEAQTDKAIAETEEMREKKRQIQAADGVLAKHPDKSPKELYKMGVLTPAMVAAKGWSAQSWDPKETQQPKITDPRVNQALAEYRRILQEFEGPIGQANLKKNYPGRTAEDVAVEMTEKRFPGVGESVIKTGKPGGEAPAAPQAVPAAPAPAGLPPGSTLLPGKKGPHGGQIYVTPDGAKKEIW